MAEKIEILDNDGNILTKNQGIMDDLLPFIKVLQETLTPKSLAKSSAQVRNKLLSIVRRKYPPFNKSRCYKLKSQTIWDSYCDFLDLISDINLVIPFTPNKLDFVAYSQISNTFYEEMISDKNEEVKASEDEISVKEIFTQINADFVNSTLGAAEAGTISDRAAKIRAKAQGVGYSVTETDDGIALVEEIKELGAAYHSQQLAAAAKFRPKID